MATRPVDERTATSIKVPGSGASTVPTATKPADVSNPADQRSGATPRPVTREVRPEKSIETVPADFDFEVRSSTPRSASAEATTTANPPPDTTQGPAGPGGERPNDIPQTMRIKFRGEDREYPVDTIRMLAQQGLAVGENSPVLNVINEIKAQTGITDPKKLAEMVMTAVQRIMAARSGGANGDMAPTTTTMAAGAAGAAQAANVAAGAATPPLQLPEPNANADAVVQEFETANGVQLPDQMRAALTNVVRYGQALEQIVGTYGGMFQQVQRFSTDLQRRSAMALSSAVNAEAARVAQELGIDTQEEVQGFANWVGETDKEFPGFKKRVLTEPKAMGTAIRSYYQIMTGRKAITERDGMIKQVNTDLARAGGDMVTPRPGGGAGVAPREQADPDETKAFNTDLMSRM